MTLINTGVSIDAVTITPNPVAANATILISVQVSLVTIESTHSNMKDYTHSELAIYTNEDLNTN